MKKNKNITLKNINKFSKKFNNKRTNKVLKNINTKGNFKNLVIKSDYLQNKKTIFKNIINIDTKITNQRGSGRCWIFAFLNVIRIPMIKKYNLNNFEFSQNYLFFYDKLEKANFFINYIIKNKNTSINNLEMIHMLSKRTDDGGNWNMFINLIEKYGIIPKTNMDDHFHSKNSYELNEFYNNFLTTAAHSIKNSKTSDLNKLKDELLFKCYKILVLFLGEPPKKITWEYYKKGKKKNIYKTVENITPLEFFKKFVPYNTSNKICLINYPCKNIPYYKLYNVDLMFNINQGKLENFINVPIDIMIDAVKKSIEAKETIWTGIDTSKFMIKEHGILDTNAFNYKDIFGFNNIMNKCDALNYRQSGPNHAVMIKGFNFDKGKTNGFLVENSWGKNSGFDGNFYMDVDWFKKYTYEIVVDKKFVSKKVLSVLNTKPILLPYYSPFGALLFK
jgi:bleomycin hydrolase